MGCREGPNIEVQRIPDTGVQGDPRYWGARDAASALVPVIRIRGPQNWGWRGSLILGYSRVPNTRAWGSPIPGCRGVPNPEAGGPSY